MKSAKHNSLCHGLTLPYFKSQDRQDQTGESLIAYGVFSNPGFRRPAVPSERDICHSLALWAPASGLPTLANEGVRLGFENTP